MRYDADERRARHDRARAGHGSPGRAARVSRDRQDPANCLLTIINDILDFSKIEAGQIELDLHDFDLRDALGTMTKSLGVRAHQKGLELVCDVAPDVPIGCWATLHRMAQILINLLGNAIKFTEVGEIAVRVTVRGPTSAGAPGVGLHSPSRTPAAGSR